MNPVLLPFAALLIILPFPGTVAARLLFLLTAFLIALWQWFRVPGARATIPCKPYFALWIVVCLSSMIWAIDPPYSLREIQNELGYTMMAFFAFFVIARDIRSVLWLSRAVVLGLLVIGGWALMGSIGNGFSWEEGSRSYGGTGSFISYLVNIIPVLAWFAFMETHRFRRYLAFGLGVLVLLLAGLTLQRVAWPVLVVQGLIGVGMLYRSGRLNFDRRNASIALGLVVVFGVSGLLVSQQVRYGFTARQGTYNTITTDVRLSFWPKVAATIAEHPVSGAGFGRRILQKAYPQLIPADAPDVLHGHNIFLNYGLSMGVLGILALLTLFISWGVFFFRAASGVSVISGTAGLMLVAGLVTRNQFNDFFMRDISMLFWALMGIFARRVIEENSTKDNQGVSP